ncbi:MAG: hypothetical protein AB8H79_15580 [Myxococcota bacterium]
MSRSLVCLVLLCLPACTSVRGTETVSVDGEGVRVVAGRVQRGDVRLISSGTGTQIEVEALVWGNGRNEERASERQDGVRWSAVRDGEALVLDGSSSRNRSGVDLTVFGPQLVDTDLVVENGDIDLNNIDGIHLLTADNITGDVVGDLDIVARQAVDLNFFPYAETDARIQADDGVTLGLPFGLDYDLTIRGDAGSTMEIEDLGWDDLVLGDGFVNGLRGRGDIEIDIIVSGPVRIVSVR